jgi:hypothetical protein
MRDQGVVSSRSAPPLRGGSARRLAPTAGTTWAFVYIFFTNGIPFDAPNRSEPCSLS